jgi:hypothetical protein
MSSARRVRLECIRAEEVAAPLDPDCSFFAIAGWLASRFSKISARTEALAPLYRATFAFRFAQ